MISAFSWIIRKIIQESKNVILKSFSQVQKIISDFILSETENWLEKQFPASRQFDKQFYHLIREG